MARFSQYYQRLKNVIHAFQALAIFVAWAITIAILTKTGKVDERVWYYFALCWCCIPALIYQTASPVFPRIRRFSNAYVHAVIDILYTIFWLAAFACLIAWVKQGSHAAKDWKSKDSWCDEFAWGPVSKCKLGQGAWILGIVICVMFAVTAAFSIYGLSYYRKNGSSPEYSIRDGEHLPVENSDFSADMGNKPNDHEITQPDHANEDGPQYMYTNTEQQIHPSGPSAWNLQQPHTAPAELDFEPIDTSYHGGGHPSETSQQIQSQPSYHYPADNARYNPYPSNQSQVMGELPAQIGVSPSRHNLALEYDHGGYRNDGRVDFPEGNYGR